MPAGMAASCPVDTRCTQVAVDYVASNKLPVELVCPITQTCMQDPILTVQGNVYEHATITLWLQTHDTDSLINASLKAPTLIPCNRIKSEIEALRQKCADLAQKQPCSRLQNLCQPASCHPEQTPILQSQRLVPLSPKQLPNQSSLVSPLPQALGNLQSSCRCSATLRAASVELPISHWHLHTKQASQRRT